MPSKSKAQHRLMVAASHDEAFAKRVGVPQSVAEEYEAADEKRRSSRTGKHATRRAFTKLGNRPS